MPQREHDGRAKRRTAADNRLLGCNGNPVLLRDNDVRLVLFLDAFRSVGDLPFAAVVMTLQLVLVVFPSRSCPVGGPGPIDSVT